MIGRTRRRVAVLLVAATAATVAVIHFVPIVSDFTVPIVGSVIGVGCGTAALLRVPAR